MIVNHSFQPNAIFLKKNQRVWIKMKQNICKGEEILVNYGHSTGDANLIASNK